MFVLEHSRKHLEVRELSFFFLFSLFYHRRRIACGLLCCLVASSFALFSVLLILLAFGVL